MTEGISNPRRGPSKAGRKRMAESGRRNLTAYHAKATRDAAARVKAVEQFRADLLIQMGGVATGARLALLEAACATYGAILLVRGAMANSRVREPLALIERITWLDGSLLRLLKELRLEQVKPRPRTLADIVQK
jgi:hypothetical protein